MNFLIAYMIVLMINITGSFSENNKCKILNRICMVIMTITAFFINWKELIKL